MNNYFVTINDQLVLKWKITKVEYSQLITETVVVYLDDNTEHIVTGFAAIELVWLLKPSALEGNNKIKWKKHAWAIHNLFAHPLMQILSWCGLYKLAIWIHDVTIPKPIGVR